jgi:integron integrase
MRGRKDIRKQDITPMLNIPPAIARDYQEAAASGLVPVEQRVHYLRWLRYYLDFCHKYDHDPEVADSLLPFEEKLIEKHQEDWKREQASQAVALYHRMLSDRAASSNTQTTGGDATASDPSGSQGVTLRSSGTQETKRPASRSRPLPDVPPPTTGSHPGYDTAPDRPRGSPLVSAPHPPSGDPLRAPQPLNRSHRPDSGAALATASSPLPPTNNCPSGQAPGASWVWVFEGLKSAIAVRHYSQKTFHAYRHWLRKFQAFVHSKDPALADMEDVKAFLSTLATKQKVAASSQNQAFNALLFLFRHVLEKPFGNVEGVVRAKRRRYIPVVLSRDEVDRVVGHLSPPHDLIAKLLYGCGLRLFECMKLRVQDVNFDMKILTIHDGKGQKDRTVPLPQVLLPELQAQLETVIRIHQQDLKAGYAGTFLPSAVEQKYKNAPRELVWQWFLPASALTRISGSDERRRYHLHESTVQKAIKAAVAKARIPKRASAHSFRHSFASHLLQANYDIATIQKLLGHSDVRTTMIYTQTVASTTLKEAKSPLDF